MTEEDVYRARLIPTSGIQGNSPEQEKRATSALLAVMSVVKEFGRAITSRAGAGAGRIECFVEEGFALGERTVHPDGRITISRGKTSWTALVEVKTGRNPLAVPQLESYLTVAKARGFDALISISNEISPAPGVHPSAVDKRKFGKVALHHFAWSEILTHAIMEKEHKGVSDPEQAWILGELIRYLEHPQSGAIDFTGMGEGWPRGLTLAKIGSLRAADKEAVEMASRFDALLRYVGLKLGRQLGREVTMVLTSQEQNDPAIRTRAAVTKLVSNGQLEGVLRIPDTVGSIVVTADLRAGLVRCHLEIEASRQPRAATRVKWLTRQLAQADGRVEVEAIYARQRGPGEVGTLAVLRDRPEAIISDPNRDLRRFRVLMTRRMGTKNGVGRGSFIQSVEDATHDFYTEVVERLRVWQVPPVRKPQPDPPLPESRVLTTTALSSQDGPGASSET